MNEIFGQLSLRENKYGKPVSALEKTLGKGPYNKKPDSNIHESTCSKFVVEDV